MKLFRILFVILLISGCAELQNVKKNILGVPSSQNLSGISHIKEGMKLDEVKKFLGEEVKEPFKTTSTETLHGYEEGFVVEEKGIVKEAFEYRTIQPNDTLFNLVSLNMNVIQVFASAGWPLMIASEKDAHVFYYRTGTLLIKDNELINTFNRFEFYNVSVNAFRGEKINNPVYFIMPSVQGIDRNSPEFIEVKEYVGLLLRNSGKITENPKAANVILFVNFGVGDKNVDVLSYSAPVYKSVLRPGSTRTIGSVQYTTPPHVSEEYAGEVSSQVSVERYRRHLTLEAIDASPFNSSGEKKYFWKTSIENIGSDTDFRAILPVMTYAAEGYIFKNSGRAVKIRVNFDQMMDFFLEVFSR